MVPSEGDGNKLAAVEVFLQNPMFHKESKEINEWMMKYRVIFVGLYSSVDQHYFDLFDFPICWLGFGKGLLSKSYAAHSPLVAVKS